MSPHLSRDVIVVQEVERHLLNAGFDLFFFFLSNQFYAGCLFHKGCRTAAYPEILGKIKLHLRANVFVRTPNISFFFSVCTVELGSNDLGFCDTSSVAS
jgi:hypothetical protein